MTTPPMPPSSRSVSRVVLAASTRSPPRAGSDRRRTEVLAGHQSAHQVGELSFFPRTLSLASSQSATGASWQVANVGTRRDTGELRTRVHELIQSNKRLAKETSVKLKRLADLRSNDPAEQRNRRAVQSRLAQDFQTWGAKFQEMSTLDLNKERKAAQEAAVAYPDDGSGDRFYRGGAEEDERAAVRRHEEQQQVSLLQHQTDLNEQIMRERNAEIREVESAVVEVGQIFQDLATLVNEQGLAIDNIESNISDAAEATTEGVRHLESADEYQVRVSVSLVWFPAKYRYFVQTAKGSQALRHH